MIEHDQTEWEYDMGDQQDNQDNPEPEDEGEGIYEVNPWTVAVTKARSRFDMRPQKTLRTHNKYGALSDNLEDQEWPTPENVPVTPGPKWIKKRGSSAANQTIASVEKNSTQNIGAVSKVDRGWERVSVKVDSGAVDTVMPLRVATHIEVRETEASRSGPGFKAANGTTIKHHGVRKLHGVNDNFQTIGMTAQVADVNTTLASVNKMLQAGNRVHFETGNCYIEHVRTGKRTTINERNGAFEIGIGVPEEPKTTHSKENPTGFRRQDLGADCGLSGSGSHQ